MAWFLWQQNHIEFVVVVCSEKKIKQGTLPNIISTMHETSCTIWWINQSEHYLIKCECNFFPLRLYYHKFNMILLPQKPCHTWLRFYILLLKELLFFVLFCFALHISLFFVKKEWTKVISSSKISPETNNTQFFYNEKVKILITFCFHSP